MGYNPKYKIDPDHNVHAIKLAAAIQAKTGGFGEKIVKCIIPNPLSESVSLRFELQFGQFGRIGNAV